MTIRNVDTNTCMYVIQEHPQFGAEARLDMAYGCKLTSGVVGELLYSLYWGVVRDNGICDLESKDRQRRYAVDSIKNLHTKGLVSSEGIDELFLALDIFMYRRLDWVDSYLVARKLLYGEDIVTFDTGILKTVNEMHICNGKIPVVSSYTLPVSSLPMHMCVRPDDAKRFEKLGLLNLK